jgi:pimeloyl-ACP methyl ester carboxylesterase
MDANYSPTAQAERLRDFVHALGITELHIGGNSMGGQIAMTYAALHPKEVKSLWLLDAAGVWSGPNSMVRTTIETTGKNPLIIRTEDDYVALMHWVMYKPPFIPRPVLDVLARERTTNQTLEERILRDITNDSVEQRIAGLTVPTLIVWGSNDKLIHPETAKIINRLMPNSQVIIMPETGHLPMIEHPRQTAKDYLAFRASLGQ